MTMKVHLTPSIDLPSIMLSMIDMNILIWNYRGALNPFFQSIVRDMV